MGGGEIRCVPKIQCENLEETDHSIYFKDAETILLLKINGIFSCILSSKPFNKLLNECSEVLLLTPYGPWDPNTDVYYRNEESMLDCKGDMVDQKECVRVLMLGIKDNRVMEVSAVISEEKSSLIDKL